ncbi:Non-reducing polyketide synthase ausA [Apiospora phragmitis]|uniref:Non-reducing polyketide synthase ausA n=1 Tax=Apiospora phragmitis TaxID=2905665 RepID=A0ABR1TVT1_9PEZI
MKNPFCLTAVYKTFDGGELQADIRVPYAKEGKPFGVKCPVFIDIPSEAGLGMSYSINKKHSEDLVHRRRYVVVSPEYRALEPAVDSSLKAPIQDCRDLLAWIYDSGLQQVLDAEHPGLYPVDCDRVYASGISHGGLLALSLGWDVPRPVAGILAVAGPCHFSDDRWKASQETTSGLSSQQRHSDPKSLGLDAAPNSSIFDVTMSEDDDQLSSEIDPVMHVHSSFPPVFIVHGTKDEMTPAGAAAGAGRCELAEVEGAGHLFASTLRESPEATKQVSRGVDFLTSA